MKTFNRIFAIFIIAILPLIESCSLYEYNEPKIDHLVFGHFYGFCVGEECVEIFKLTSYNLFEDKNDIYPEYDCTYEGDFEQLTNDKFLLVKNLINKFPDRLYSEENNIIGSPDDGDWGGLYVEIMVDGYKSFWLIDQLTENIPEYLHGFVQEVNMAIESLR